jgi:hypothetical protein
MRDVGGASTETDQKMRGIGWLNLAGSPKLFRHSLAPSAWRRLRIPLLKGEGGAKHQVRGKELPFLWRHLDQEVFAWISQLGYPVAGFNASHYLKTMSAVSDSTTPPKLAADFERVIALAKASMNLPVGTPVIFVGIFRGAGRINSRDADTIHELECPDTINMASAAMRATP